MHDTSSVMETRRRFQEAYGQTAEEKDYGSMENLANAHREYLAQVRQRYHAREPPRMRQVIHWVEIFRTTVTDGHTHVQMGPYVPQQPHIIGGSMQFEAAGFMRRFFAEVIDFFIVLTMKLAFVALLLELDLVDLSAYSSSLEEDQDVMQFINLAQDLLPLEMASKVLCCILEGIFMSYHILWFGIGQTPGKWMMGIRVISCTGTSAAEIPGHIIVQNPNTITLQQGLKRSFMKNVIVNSLFPLSTAAFQVTNGRVFYDCFVGTAVIIDI